jgi:thioredoxin 1
MYIQIEADVNQLIKDSQKIVVLDFFAEWCVPCKSTTQSLHQLDQKYSNYVDVVMVNVDCDNTLSEQFNIKAIPTLLFFKDNQLRHTKVGASSFREIQSIIDGMI